LNTLAKKDPYPLPFIDEVLDSIAGKELYSFLDEFSGYNHGKIKAKDREKIAFIIE
jgi:hypothetical protein